MDLEKGKTVKINATAFTGAHRRSKQSIDCEILDFNENEVHVLVQQPYKERKLWIDKKWIDHDTVR